MKAGDGLKDRYRKEIIRILSENPRVERIVLFGSRAMGTFTPESDIDIVLYGDDLSLTDLAQLKQALEETTIPQKVDLLLAKDIEKKELLEHIKKYGVEWWRRGNRPRAVPPQEDVEIKNLRNGNYSGPGANWRKMKLGDFLTLQRGFDLPKYKRKPGPYPVIAATGQVGTHEEAKVKAPGVVIGRSGSIGGGQYINENFWPLNTTLWVKDFKGNDPRFSYYLLKSLNLSFFNAGSGVPTLNRNHIHPLMIIAPPLPEQRAIAHILGTLDDKIELNREMNKTLEEMAQAIFKSWFIDFDPVVWKAVKAGKTVPEKFFKRAAYYKESGKCPVPEEILALFPDSFQDSELGPIPEGWRVISLYDSARYINGAAFRNNHFTDEKGALPIVKIAELKNGITGQTKFTKIEMDAKYKINTGEILLSWSGNPDTSIGTFVWSGGPAWLNQHIFRVLPFRTFEKYFVFYLLGSLKPVFAAIAKNKQTTGLGHFTIRDMKQLLIVWPIESLIIKFNEFVGPVFEYWFSNIFESSLLSSLRDTLLPKLISGELRVPNVEKFLKEAGL